jgi:hypothetical protein
MESREKREKKLNFYDQQFCKFFFLFLSPQPRRKRKEEKLRVLSSRSRGGENEKKRKKNSKKVGWTSHRLILKMKRFSLEIKSREMQIRTFSMQRQKIIILSFTYFYLNNAVFKKALQHSLKWFFFLLLFSFFRGGGGGSMLGDVNISAILDSFSVSYDKRVRPNYGGKHHVYLS